jgi:hypothetical protein
MADTTTRYGWPYQEASDPPDGGALGQDLAEAVEISLGSVDDRVGDAETNIIALQATATATTARLNAAKSTITTAATAPLSSAANSPAQIISRSFAFKAGFAYRISVWARLSITGATASSGIPYVQIRRASAAGTVIHDPGGQGLAGGTGFTSSGVQSCVVKCSADTTQTISFCATWSGTGTAINVAATASARPYILIEEVGLAADFPDAMEVPTS